MRINNDSRGNSRKRNRDLDIPDEIVRRIGREAANGTKLRRGNTFGYTLYDIGLRDRAFEEKNVKNVILIWIGSLPTRFSRIPNGG